MKVVPIDSNEFDNLSPSSLLVFNCSLEKKEKDKFELFFKDNSKEILKVIQNVNGREFIWESL